MLRSDALGMTMPQKVLDLVCSSRVIRSLEVLFPDWNPSDDTMSDLTSAIEKSDSITELCIGETIFHNEADLILFPSRYRIRYHCRRNGIQTKTLRHGSNIQLMALILSRLLGDSVETEGKTQKEIESRGLVDRSVAFELLKDIPALFVHGGK